MRLSFSIDHRSNRVGKSALRLLVAFFKLERFALELLFSIAHPSSDGALIIAQALRLFALGRVRGAFAHRGFSRLPMGRLSVLRTAFGFALGFCHLLCAFEALFTEERSS